MAKSIIQKEKECLICRTTYGLHDHHVFYGTANRRLSEKYGLKVWLCMEHHTGNNGVHRNPKLDSVLKRIGQRKFENRCGSREDFMRIFGRNYL